MSVITANMLVQASIVLILYTVLYGDNPVSRFGQGLLMGVQSGYLIMINLNFYYTRGVQRIPTEFHYIIPVIWEYSYSQGCMSRLGGYTVIQWPYL